MIKGLAQYQSDQKDSFNEFLYFHSRDINKYFALCWKGKAGHVDANCRTIHWGQQFNLLQLENKKNRIQQISLLV